MQGNINTGANFDKLSETFIGNEMKANTCTGFGKIHKLYGKTEEVGTGEKSPNNPYKLECVADDVNLFDPNLIKTIKTLNGITCSIQDEVLTFNGTCTTNNTCFVFDLNMVIKGVKDFTNAFIQYISGSLTNSTPQTSFSLFDTGYNYNTWDSLKSENLQIICNYETALYEKVQFRFDNGVVANNFKVRVKISQKPQEVWSKYGEGNIIISSANKQTDLSHKIINCEPLCYYENKAWKIKRRDYIDFDKQKIIRQCKYLVVDDSENWFLEGELANCLRIALSITSKGITLNSDGICSHLKWTSNYTLDEPHFYTYNNYLYIFIPKTIASTLEAFKTWLHTNPMTFILSRNNTEEDIDITNSIVQYQGETLVFNLENAEMEVELTNNETVTSLNKNISILQEEGFKKYIECMNILDTSLKYKGQLFGNSNYNDLSIGFYDINTFTGAGGTGSPGTNLFGSLVVLNRAQIYIGNSTILIRCITNNTWTSWTNMKS